jgi:hypothetical protein
LCALIEPVYPKAGQGRPPVGVERMLRIYFVQQWFKLKFGFVKVRYRGIAKNANGCLPRARW